MRVQEDGEEHKHDDRVISVAFEVKGELIFPRMQVCPPASIASLMPCQSLRSKP